MSMNSIPSSASELANRIAGPARYKFDILLEGIAAEQTRLVGGPFLALLWVRVFDFEGLMEWLVLGDACPNVSAASQYLAKQFEAFQLAQTRLRALSEEAWEIDHGRSYVLPLNPPDSIRIQSTRTLTLDGGPYHRIYLCGHVLGPFPAGVVGHELFDTLKGLHETWQWFLSVGESRRTGRPIPTIMKHIEA
jgi:hypothetical protein